MEALSCVLVGALLTVELTPRLTTSQQSIKSWVGTGEKNFANVSLRVISGWCHSHFHPLIPRPVNPGCGGKSPFLVVGHIQQLSFTLEGICPHSLITGPLEISLR